MAKTAQQRADYIQRYEIDRKKKEIIRQMLFGPYEDSWRNDNGIVENSDEAIAKRLGMETPAVSFYTTSMMEKHFREITIKRNNYPWVLPPELEILKFKPQYKK